jgi:hypothetical protein
MESMRNKSALIKKQAEESEKKAKMYMDKYHQAKTANELLKGMSHIQQYQQPPININQTASPYISGPNISGPNINMPDNRRKTISHYSPSHPPQPRPWPLTQEERDVMQLQQKAYEESLIPKESAKSSVLNKAANIIGGVAAGLGNLGIVAASKAATLAIDTVTQSTKAADAVSMMQKEQIIEEEANKVQSGGVPKKKIETFAVQISDDNSSTSAAHTLAKKTTAEMLKEYEKLEAQFGKV